MVRVDQAGEIGANWIYKGQMAVLGKDKKVGPIIQVIICCWCFFFFFLSSSQSNTITYFIDFRVFDSTIETYKVISTFILLL